MLPGFICHKKQKIHECNVIYNLEIDIQNKTVQSIDKYKSDECIEECYIEVKMIYYEFLIENEKVLSRNNSKSDLGSKIGAKHPNINKKNAEDVAENKKIDDNEQNIKDSKQVNTEDIMDDVEQNKKIDDNEQNIKDSKQVNTEDIMDDVEQNKKIDDDEQNIHINKKRKRNNKNAKNTKNEKYELLNDPNSCLRRLGVIKTKNKSDIKEMLSDPIYTVRYAAINKIQPCTELIRFLNDKNWQIRVKTIEKLSNKHFLRKINQSDLNLIFTNICKLINDINVNVRVLVAKVIQNFKRINKFKIKELISKKNINDNVAPGTFVHGFEDENEDVRANMIESICILTCDKEMANEAFDFLSDLLNDDIDKVKEQASFWMLKLSQSYKITVKDEMIDLLFCNFLEKSENLKNNLFDAFNFLEFNENIVEYIFFKWLNLLIKKNETNKILKCIKALVKKNISFFYINYNKYKESIFNKKNIELKKVEFIITNLLREDCFEVECDENNILDIDLDVEEEKPEVELICADVYHCYFDLPIKYNIQCKTTLRNKDLYIKIINNGEILNYLFARELTVFLHEKNEFFDIVVKSKENDAELYYKRVPVVYK